MSVVLLAEGVPPPDVLDAATTAARDLATDLVVVSPAALPALLPFSADLWVATLASHLAPLDAPLVLTADTPHARAFFPALALRLSRPLLSSATRLRVLSPDRLEIERPLHAGLQTERLLLAPPLFLTLASSSSSSSSSSSASAFVSASASAPRDTLLRVIPPSAATVDLRSADRIVAGGLGLGSKDGVALLERLAKLLGAAVGGTRVISDRGWIAHERYIGSTGKTVAPRLYLALGISGASQHLVGMTDSEAIVAINTDRAAPIFGVADLGVLGDLHAIVPELEKRLASHARQARRASGASAAEEPR